MQQSAPSKSKSSTPMPARGRDCAPSGGGGQAAARGKPEPRAGTPRRLAYLYREHVVDTGRERRFLIAISFFLTYLFVRFITHSIKDHHLGFLFHNVGGSGGLHIHHMVFGIIGLMVAGYITLALQPRRRGAVLLLCLLLGISLALTLDEFALWLNLKDVYWQREGRESVDVVLIVGALISVAAAGRSLFRAMAHDLGTIWHDLRVNTR